MIVVVDMVVEVDDVPFESASVALMKQIQRSPHTVGAFGPHTSGY